MMRPTLPWLDGFDGRVALVTGAGRGLGRACALGLAAAGAHVIAVARTAADLESLAAEAAHSSDGVVSGAVEAWPMDVADEAFYGRIERLARLDVLVNNAGMNRPLPMVDVDPATLDAMLALNVRAVYRTAQAAVRAMLRAGHGGAVVNMSSQMGHVGAAKRTVYCLTKHAVEGLTKAMAVELAPYGIRVNSVAPTFIETDLTRPMFADAAFRRAVEDGIPLGRIGRPEDVVGAVLYLASSASGLVTGDSLKVDGGWTAR